MRTDRSIRPAVAAAWALALPTVPALAQPVGSAADRYPEGAEIPRSLTPAERELIARDPIVAAPSRAAPPGRVRTPAEYDPCEGIMIAWEGSSSWLSILAQMARDITTIGDAKVFVMVDTANESSSASASIAALGADMSKVSFHVRTTDTIWMRDYGPRYIYLGTDEQGQGGVRAIVDHTYNRPRPNDNGIPAYWGAQRQEPVYLLPLVHGGGNFHLASGFPEGIGNATRLIANENPSLTDQQIVDIWHDYQNLDTTLYTPYPTTVDSTQHIDMWMIMLDTDKVMISQWVNEPNASWAISSDQAASDLEARGFTVYRVPAVRSGGTHYTFTNAVICNDLVLIPSYTNATAAPFNDDALAAWQQAYPGKTIKQINCQALVTSAGVMHCIVMHVPAGSNGDAPGVYMTTSNSGGEYQPGALLITDWLFDDDDVTSADLYLSTDGGKTFPTLIAAGFDGTSGSYYWNAPDVFTDNARVRLVLHDAQGNTAHDDSDASFSILGTPPCIADIAEPFGTLNFFDITAYIGLYNAQDPEADLAQPFGTLNFFDINAFIAAYNDGCP